MLAPLWTSALEPGPVRSGPILREHRMGGKGPGTRSFETGASQSWHCVPNYTRTDRRVRRSTIKATREGVGIAKAFANGSGVSDAFRTHCFWGAMVLASLSQTTACRKFRSEDCLRKVPPCQKLRCR